MGAFQRWLTSWYAPHLRRVNMLAILLLFIVPMLWFYSVLGNRAASGDHYPHNQWAQLLLDDSAAFFAQVPHFLYHIITAGVAALMGIDTYLAGFITLILAHSMLGMMIYSALVWRFRLNVGMRLGAVGIILLLFLIAPINIFTPDRLYFGYINITIYHNPTTIFLRPFALMSFLIVVLSFYAPDYLSRYKIHQQTGVMIALFAAVMLLATLAKPSYTIVIVPAAALVAAYRWWRGLSVQWGWLIGGIIVPSSALILYQTFVVGTGNMVDVGQPTIAPFALFNIWHEGGRLGANQHLLGKLILSTAFQIVVYALHWRQARRATLLNVAFVAFAVSLGFAYFVVYENFTQAGDFIWGAFVANFILFVAAWFFLFRHYHQRTMRQLWDGRLLASLLIFALHVIAGLHWYILHLQSGSIVLGTYY